jgi:hypothetical protein
MVSVGVMLGLRYDHFYDSYYTLFPHVCSVPKIEPFVSMMYEMNCKYVL